MRYIIAVNRDKLDSDPDCTDPIMIEDTTSGVVVHGSDVRIDGPCRIRFDASGRQNGTRVWIETNSLPVVEPQALS